MRNMRLIWSQETISAYGYIFSFIITNTGKLFMDLYRNIFIYMIRLRFLFDVFLLNLNVEQYISN